MSKRKKEKGVEIPVFFKKIDISKDSPLEKKTKAINEGRGKICLIKCSNLPKDISILAFIYREKKKKTKFKMFYFDERRLYEGEKNDSELEELSYCL